MNKPKLTITEANQIRHLYQEGASINSLSKRYDLSRTSIKLILRGETYNKYNQHVDLRPKKETTKLF